MSKIRHLFSLRTELLGLAVVSLALQLYASDIDAKLISTLAGTGSDGFSGDGGIATNAQLDPERECFRVAVDPNGDVYVADVSNNRVRKITISDGTISTVAGDGSAGFSGDGGSATNVEDEHVVVGPRVRDVERDAIALADAHGPGVAAFVALPVPGCVLFVVDQMCSRFIFYPIVPRSPARPPSRSGRRSRFRGRRRPAFRDGPPRWRRTRSRRRCACGRSRYAPLHRG